MDALCSWVTQTKKKTCFFSFLLLLFLIERKFFLIQDPFDELKGKEIDKKDSNSYLI